MPNNDKFLTLEGLTYYDSKIKEVITDSIPEIPELSAVATSGSYEDLTDKPVIPVVPQLATVATTGSYDDLNNKPVYEVINTLEYSISGSSSYSCDYVNEDLAQGLSDSGSGSITDGTYIPFAEGDIYNIAYEGALYEGLTVTELAFTDYYRAEPTAVSLLYFGNIKGLVTRTSLFKIIPAVVRDTLEDSDIPFCLLVDVTNEKFYSWVDLPDAVDRDFIITSATDMSNHYTITINSYSATEYMQILPGDFTYNRSYFGLPSNPAVTKEQVITYNGDTETITWAQSLSNPDDQVCYAYMQSDVFGIYMRCVGQTGSNNPEDWFDGAYLDGDTGAISASGSMTIESELQQLDTKFIPSTIARTSDITINSISVNGTAQTITNKNVNITLPSAAASIADGATGYATGDQVYDYVEANKGDTNIIESVKFKGNGDSTASALTIDSSDKSVTIDISGYALSSSFGTAATADTTDFVSSNLAPAEAGAQANVIETVKVNGSALTPDANKAVDITIPVMTSSEINALFSNS